MGNCEKISNEISGWLVEGLLKQRENSPFYKEFQIMIRGSLGKNPKIESRSSITYLIEEEFSQIKRRLMDKKEEEISDVITLYIFGRMTGLDKQKTLEILKSNIKVIGKELEEIENIVDNEKFSYSLVEVNLEKLDRKTIERIIREIKIEAGLEKEEGHSILSNLEPPLYELENENVDV